MSMCGADRMQPLGYWWTSQDVGANAPIGEKRTSSAPNPDSRFISPALAAQFLGQVLEALRGDVDQPAGRGLALARAALVRPRDMRGAQPALGGQIGRASCRERV